MKNVLIVGGLGYLGTSFINYLTSKSNNKVYIHNLNEENTLLNKASFSIYNKLESEKFCEQHNIEVIFNFIYDSNDVDDTINKILSCVPNCRYIFLSTSMVYNIDCNSISENHPTIPNTEYGIYKLNAEKYIVSNSNDYFIFRLFNPIGYSDKYCIDNKKSRQIFEKFKGYESATLLTNHKGDYILRDYVSIDSVMNVLKIAIDIKFSNEIFNLGSGIASPIVKAAKYQNKNLIINSEISNINYCMCADITKIKRIFGVKLLTPWSEKE